MKRWDILILNETFRAQKKEAFCTSRGHDFFGSGGAAGKHGVGILLNQKWHHCWSKWEAISPRLGCLEVRFGKMRMSITAAYLPHGGYTDEEVEAVYVQISSLIKPARKKGHSIIVAGDFNAEVGSAKDMGKAVSQTGRKRLID